MSVSPELGVKLDDAVAVVSASPNVRLAEARVAPPGQQSLVSSRPDPVREEKPAPEVGISAARAVQVSEPAAPPSQPSRPQPQQRPPVEPPPAPLPVAAPAPDPAATPVASPQLVASFDRPYLQSVLDRDDGSSEVVTVQVLEGQEYAFAFSFQILQMIYGEPGADNLIVHLDSDASEEASFGLQLWDYAADDWQADWRGLWVSGEATGGDRFLAPVTEGVWHDVVLHFKVAGDGTGFYEVYLDGQQVDARSAISTIPLGSGFAQVELGLFRDGERVQGTSEILFDATRLGSTLESVQAE